MKKRINLFAQRIENLQVERYVDLGRRITYGATVFGIIGLFILGGFYAYLIREMRNLESEKNVYSRYIFANEKFSKQISRFLFKYALLKQYLKDDVDNYYSYESIQNILYSAGVTYSIDAFSIDNEHKVSFSLKPTTYEDAIDVISRIEDSSVLNRFESLSLESFNIPQSQSDFTLTYNAVLAK